MLHWECISALAWGIRHASHLQPSAQLPVSSSIKCHLVKQHSIPVAIRLSLCRLTWQLLLPQGFQEQTKHWPQQPLDAAVAWVRSLPSSTVVADFGCGDAQLARRVQQKVISLDLVAPGPHVVACDMAHTPLGTPDF